MYGTFDRGQMRPFADLPGAQMVSTMSGLALDEEDMELDDDAPEFVDDFFWENCAKWPPDLPGHVFLARAFDQIGQSKYRPRWAEVVTKTPEPDLPSPDSAKSVWDQFWRDAEKYADEEEKATANRDKKWKVVTRSIAESCARGSLLTAAQAKSGGDIIDLDTSFWNTENYDSHFYRCDASLHAPFTARQEKKDHWIYVTRESLNTYLETLSAARPKRGKPPGVGSMAEMDEPHIQKMAQLIQDRKAKTPNDAARQVAGEVTGGKFESNQHRLGNRFRARFPDWEEKFWSNDSEIRSK
jgi:hypothetical protein